MTILGAASSNDVAPGTLGFLVVFGMAVLLFFVFRSMSKHLRKVNAAAREDQDTGSPDDQAAGSPDDQAAGSPEDKNAGAAPTSSRAGSGTRRRDS